MPFKSQAQWRLFRAMLDENKIDRATYDEWVNASPAFESLPESKPAAPQPRKKRKRR